MTNIERRDIDDPEQDARVTAVLSAAAAPVEPGPLPGEEAALAAFGAVHHRSGRKRMRSLVPFKTGLAAAVGAGVLFTGGVAAAATTGSLPDPAQSAMQTVLGGMGITVPGCPRAKSSPFSTEPTRVSICSTSASSVAS